MKILGLCLCIFMLFFALCWVISNRKNKEGVVFISVLGIFVSLFLILQDRVIELTIKNIGTIKTAQEQATGDATVISDLRKRVEAQNATVDFVVKNAHEAKQLIDELTKKNQTTDEKLATLDKTILNAKESLANINRITEFVTTLLAAQNDSWEDFKQLTKLMDDQSFPLREIASNAVVNIKLDYMGPLEKGFLNFSWEPGFDTSRSSLEDFIGVYRKFNPIYHAHLLHYIKDRNDFSRKDKMRFFIEVLKTSNSLNARNYAANFFVNAADDKDLKWYPFNIGPLTQWWEAHSDKIK